MAPDAPGMRRLAVLAIVLALSGAPALGAGAPTAPETATSVTTQLPRGVRPLHYDVALTPDEKAMRFAGRVAITLDVGAPTTRLTLNALELSFESVRLARTVSVAVDGRSTRQAAPVGTVLAPMTLAAGRHRLFMRYSGVINTQANGLFAIDYDTPSGRARALYTQFENSDARRVFPSWDEPAYKATFALEATVPTAQMAVSNMPATATTPASPGLSRVRFATTPTMSTYLLFFAAGDFERTTLPAGRTEIGVVTRRGVAAQARFALESTRDILREYEDYAKSIR